MTKKDLVKIIQEVVRKEVQKEVKKIFIKENTSPKLIDIISKTSTSEKEPIKEKHYTKNEALNKILNETVSGLKSNRDEYPTMGGEAFDTSRMSELIGYGNSEDMQRDMVAVDTFKKAGVTSEQVPDYVTNALTRDYSNVMKALQNKKG
tara:strand:+ start:336 stop:782 length:447 start_codon:yes stop_codon:yes gene_type:complete